MESKCVLNCVCICVFTTSRVCASVCKWTTRSSACAYLPDEGRGEGVEGGLLEWFNMCLCLYVAHASAREHGCACLCTCARAKEFARFLLASSLICHDFQVWFWHWSMYSLLVSVSSSASVEANPFRTDTGSTTSCTATRGAQSSCGGCFRSRGYTYLQLLWLDAQLSSQLNSQCSSIYLRADRPGWVKLVDQSVGLSTSWHGFPNHIYLKLTVRHCCVNLSIRKKYHKRSFFIETIFRSAHTFVIARGR